MIRNRLKTSYTRKKSYPDHRRMDLEFEEGDKMHLKISPMKGVMRFKKWKFSPLYVGPYEFFKGLARLHTN